MVGDDGLVALVEQLPHVPQLEVLALGSSVGGNHVGDAGAARVGAALAALDAPQRPELSLHLKHNMLSREGIAALEAALAGCHFKVELVAQVMAKSSSKTALATISDVSLEA